MDILSFFVAAFDKIDNVAILILLVMLGLMVWMNINQRREDREDRKVAMETIGKNTDALHAVEKALVIMAERIK